MALSNAQRQAQHHQRRKARLALAAPVESFRRTVAEQVAAAGGDPACRHAVADHLARMMSSNEGTEIVRCFLAQAAGITGDDGVGLAA